MWWSDRRRILASILVAAAAGVGPGCGFEPLYGSGGSGGTPDVLANIQIDPIADRNGQMLHNSLSRGLRPRGVPGRTDYVLRVGLTESKYSLGIRKDDVATRANLIITATFNLWDPQNEREILTGRTTSTNSYNILSDDFATVSAEKNARERGIQQVAQDIQTRLAVFLSSGRRPPASPR